ncbi:N-acetylmuramidase [Secundilactobacillus paracollinoides]|uniref:N-acetylmuramidase n=1 Tax=Secundilactobacillus paracollinoides TaxID=240427 RepID=A0A1B2IYY6_9LACO|nr:glucosaminidase domain-containing protein [Secundilactobacillus paracollinoides]ANZ61374.1 N-acetylmuramidase [Secundilactobacillus paracollinoides]ANZ64232.1 N-acetylmuramidase [Secundilactobacillus paracollinoides]ANZ67294.1 N-acetylmuramidase [Secundilactobacillus paracollinoides]KRL78201.1 N-acetylmuramidase [Secundilactobacillus paracollinoides DSM 15502 = JCM 11969]
MAKKRRRKKSNQQGTATLIFILALFVIGGGLGARYVMNKVFTPQTTQEQSSTTTLSPQQRRQRAFIKQMATPAVKAYHETHQVLPSIVIAQAILESNWGQSQLYKEAKNPFGMKGSYNGQTQLFPTKEYENGKEVTIKDYFRVYPNLKAAILDHDLVVYHQFITTRTTNYATAAKELQTNGYATDPSYAKKLINMIESYRLARFDSY